MPDSFSFFMIFGFSCFLAGILFFRKEDVPVKKVLLPFMLSIYNPFKMKDELKTEGILLIVLGYASFIFYVVFLT